MLKLNASYSKKVPAEEEYSSKSFHASVEVELATGLNSIELQHIIHNSRGVQRRAKCSGWDSNLPLMHISASAKQVVLPVDRDKEIGELGIVKN